MYLSLSPLGGKDEKVTRRPRATKEEMMKRRETVLQKLKEAPLSIHELSDLVDLSYPQTVVMLKSLEDEGAIQRVGRENRKLIYKIGSDKLNAIKLDNEHFDIVEINGDTYIKVQDIKLLSDSDIEDLLDFI